MSALDVIETWPCDTAAAAHRRADGQVDTFGPVDQPFALASVTKLLSAAAVLIAVEEGTISLDEPDFDGGATLAELLSHASGLAPDGTRLDEPGRRRVYTSYAYEVAADAVAERSQIDFATYLHEAVCQPLGMESTALAGSPGHAGTSNVNDLLLFLDGLDRLLSTETLERMTTPHLPELIGVLPGYGRQEPNPWGLGPEIRGDKTPHWTGASNSPDTWGHFGQTGTFVWVDPGARQSLIVLTDRPFGDWVFPRWPALADAVLGAARVT